jgi:hypothetical protein
MGGVHSLIASAPCSSMHLTGNLTGGSSAGNAYQGSGLTTTGLTRRRGHTGRAALFATLDGSARDKRKRTAAKKPAIDWQGKGVWHLSRCEG